MNEKQQLIKEIEVASDKLVKKVLVFLLANKTKSNSNFSEEVEKSNHFITIAKSQKSLKNLLLEIPEVGEDVDFERKLDMVRDIEL